MPSRSTLHQLLWPSLSRLPGMPSAEKSIPRQTASKFKMTCRNQKQSGRQKPNFKNSQSPDICRLQQLHQQLDGHKSYTSNLHYAININLLIQGLLLHLPPASSMPPLEATADKPSHECLQPHQELGDRAMRVLTDAIVNSSFKSLF